MAPSFDFGDAVSRLEELSAEASAVAWRLERAESAANTSVTMSDQLDAATVTLDESGRVSAVRLHTLWQERCAADQLAAAVLAAVRAAELRRLEIWSDAMAAAEAQPPRPSVPEATTPSDTDTLPVVDLAALAEESIAVLESLGRPRASTAEPAPVPDLTAGDHARVVLAPDGSVSHLLLDANWAGRASLGRLSEALNKAFQTAYEALDTLPRTPALPVTVSPELAAVMQDPAGALLRYAKWRGFDVSSPDQSGSS